MPKTTKTAKTPKALKLSEPLLFLDFETRSKVDLPARGIVNYANSETTEVIVACYMIVDEKGKAGKMQTVFWPKNENSFPKDFTDFIHKARFDGFGKLVAFNYSFEYQILKGVLGIPTLLESWSDAMALSNRWGIYGTLDNVATTLGIGEKLSVGKNLIRKYSIPDRKTKEFLEIPKSDLKDFAEYCAYDVRLTKSIWDILPPFGDFETAAYALDKKINNRGLSIDLNSLATLSGAYDRNLLLFEKKAEKFAGRNDRETLVISANNSFKEFLEGLGVSCPNVQAKTLEKIYDDPSIKGAKGKKIREAIDLRNVIGSKAPKKLEPFKNLHKDGKIFYSLHYYGAHTGRWAGRGIQPQNLPRNAVDPSEYGKTLEKLESGDFTATEFKDLVSSLIRGLIVPSKGNVFLIGDLSAIEARVTFWVSGCLLGLSAYKEKRDIYAEFASKLPLGHIAEPKKRRQIGKLAILGLGYGMGADKFTGVLLDNKIDDRSLAEVSVARYRSTYPEIPSAWRELERAFKACMSHASGRAVYQSRFCKVEFTRGARSVRAMLPSGREMLYLEPELREGTFGEVITTMQKRGRVPIWGGVLLENVVQAISRDILVSQVLEMENAGLRTVLTEHDSSVVEVPKTGAKKNFAIFETAMNRAPSWAEGLPVGAECFISERYGK
jgi:DNA polymerase